MKPLYPFGYGLSYTTFQYSHIEVKPEVGSSVGAPYTVGFDVTNTGHMAGADVAQVYVSEAQPTVPRPPKELKGFSRVELAPGETKHVTVTLSPRAFTFYDATPKHWHADAGKYTSRWVARPKKFLCTPTSRCPAPTMSRMTSDDSARVPAWRAGALARCL